VTGSLSQEEDVLVCQRRGADIMTGNEPSEALATYVRCLGMDSASITRPTRGMRILHHLHYDNGRISTMEQIGTIALCLGTRVGDSANERCNLRASSHGSSCNGLGLPGLATCSCYKQAQVEPLPYLWHVT
jgi:hypothetical protein